MSLYQHRRQVGRRKHDRLREPRVASVSGLLPDLRGISLLLAAEYPITERLYFEF